MKKLLFIGALLVAGATSFGAVSDTFKDTSGQFTGESLSAEATLRLTSRGDILDPSGKATLVVTPTVNAGADGQSLSFDFADMIVGQQQSLVGKFTSKIVTATDDGGVEELPFGEAKITTTLGKIEENGTGTVSGNTLSGLPLLNTGDNSEIGTLTYQLSTAQTNPTTYTTEVTATAIPEGTGSFVNKGAKVTVNVTGFKFTGAAGVGGL